MTGQKSDIVPLKNMANQYLSITGQVTTKTLPTNTTLPDYKVISSSVSNMPLQCHETAEGDVECNISWDEDDKAFEVDHLEQPADMVSNHFDMFCEAER